MEKINAYQCEDCKRYETEPLKDGEYPTCCGKKMKEVPLMECVKDPAFAEHARFDDDDTPCDPGVSG